MQNVAPFLKDPDLYRNWPTGAQEELMRALTPQSDAQTIWTKWQEQYSVKDVDVHRILPALYRRLSQEGVDGGPYLRGMSRHCYVSGAVRQKVAKELAERFSIAGIPVLALKGLAMSLAFGYTPRHMEDIDLMVPLNRAEEAIDLTLASGWTSNQGLNTNNLKATISGAHAGWFQKEGLHFDLHWHSVHQDQSLSFDTPVWERSSPGTIRIPSKTDLLFQTALHGIRFGSPAHVWPADIFSIIGSYPGPIDWEVLLQTAINRRFSVQLKVLVTALNAYLPGVVPESVTLSVNKHYVSPLEALEHRGLTSRHRSLIEDRAVGKMYWYRRNVAGILKPLQDMSFFRMTRRPSSV